MCVHLVPLNDTCVCALVASVVSDSLGPLGIIACQVPLSMGFSREQYWSQLPCAPPGNLPDPGREPESLISSLLMTSATS